MSSSAALVDADERPGRTTATVRVIVGPTAAGKSEVALWLAEQAGATVVVADSRQVYRGFDVGTAKPSLDERRRVRHEGIDLVPPTERFSAAAWAVAAEGWIDAAERTECVPVVVGGTGLYCRALFEPFFEEPALDANRRRAVARVIESFDRAELERWCVALDPARSSLGRAQQLRAVEIALLTGHRLSELHVRRRRAPRRTARYLVVDPGEVLASRIASRAASMLDGGWPEEVERLRSHVPSDAPAWKSTGYRQVARYVDGACSREATLEAILVETRQYAKRQRTWFRHQLPPGAVQHLDPTRSDWRELAARWWLERETP